MAEQAYFDPAEAQNQPQPLIGDASTPGQLPYDQTQNPDQAYSVDPNYPYDPAYDSQYTADAGYYDQQGVPGYTTPSINPILTILAGVFGVILLVAWLLEAGVFGAQNPIAFSTLLGIGKPKTNVVTTSQQDPSGYNTCVQNGGRVELTLPRSCLVNNTVFFESIPGGDLAAYTAGVEAEATTKNQLVFKPKNYGLFDRIIDPTALLPDTQAYTFKESNKVTYKMQVYGKNSASTAGVTSPKESIVELTGIDDKKGYDSLQAFIVPATTSIVGEGVVTIYAKARDNVVVMTVPMKDNANMKKEGDTCAQKKFEGDGNYNDKLKQCYIDAVKASQPIQADAKVLVDKLLTNFQL